MGCGMLAFGVAAAINGWLTGLPDGVNIYVTTYNLGVLVGSILHLASAAATYRGAYSPATRRPRGRQVLLAYSAAFLLAILIVWFAVMHWIPTFFVQGVGATAVRQGVLGTAIALFALSAVLFGRLYFRTRSRFLYWYALALALIAVGLGDVTIIRMVGGPVNWLGRIAIFIGSLYFLFAILAAAQSARKEKVPFDQAMAELFRRPEEHYRAIVETVPDVIICCDAEGRVLLWNAAAVHSFGFSNQEAIGAKWVDLIVSPEQAPRMHEAMTQWSQTGAGPLTGRTLEMTALRKDGSSFPIEMSVSYRLVRQHWFSTFVIRDITARKEAALELFQVQQMIRLVLDTVPQRIFWKDRNLRFLGCNRAFAADAGFEDPQQIVSLDDHALSWMETADLYQSNDNRVMENDQAKLDFEQPQKREDGTIRWLRTSLVPLHDEVDQVVGVLGTYEDITERKQAEEALQQSHERFQLANRATFNAIWDWNLQTDALWWNENFQALFGYPAEEIEPGIESWTSRIHPEDVDRIKVGIHTAIDSGQQSWSGQYRFRRKDGVYAEVEDRGYISREVNGKPVRMIGAMQDVTDRKRVEEALRESESSLQAILRSTADGLLAVDRENRVLLANERFEEMWKIPQEVMTSKDNSVLLQHVLDQLIDPQGFLQKVQQLYASEEDSFDTLSFKDGRIFERLSRPLMAGTELRGRVWSFRDITERKRAEDALRESEHRLADIIDFLPDATFAVNLKGEVIAWNRSMEELTGVPKEELIGKGDFAYAVPFYGKPGPMLIDLIFQDREEMKENYDYLIKRRDQVVAEVFVPTLRGGKEAYLWGIASPLYDSSGSIVGAIESLRDITERKRLEEELTTKAEELARSNAELEQLAYVASHDLQEPLRMISSYVQLLARRYQGMLGTEADEFIHYAVDGATRMQALIQDLLTYSRVGGPGTKLVPVDCEKVLRQTLMDMQITITETGAIITHEPLPVIRFDPIQFAQILQNLISNAIKFRRPEVPPIIALAALQRGEEWLFSVKDNGLGVSDLFLKKAFQLFQRWQARGESPGTGIGLAVCRKIVERFGGRIWVESVVGEGSTFYFTIPLKPRKQIPEG